MDFLDGLTTTVQDGFGKLTEGAVEKEVSHLLGADANKAVSSNPDVFTQPPAGEDGDGSTLVVEDKPTVQPPKQEKPKKMALYIGGAVVVFGLLAVIALGGKK